MIANGTYSVGITPSADYQSITLAFLDISQSSISDSIKLELIANTTEGTWDFTGIKNVEIYNRVSHEGNPVAGTPIISDAIINYVSTNTNWLKLHDVHFKDSSLTITSGSDDGPFTTLDSQIYNILFEGGNLNVVSPSGFSDNIQLFNFKVWGQSVPVSLSSLSNITDGVWGSKYPLEDPPIEFADDVIIGGNPIAIRLKATANFLHQFPGVSIKPTWGSVPWYIWKFQSIPITQYPPPNSRYGFTDNSSYDGNTYDFFHGETGNRVFLQILSDNTGTNAFVKLHAVRDGVYDSDSAVLVWYSNYATYPIADFQTKSFKLELSGTTARVLYNGAAIVTPETDANGWITYTGSSPFPASALSSQTFWAQLDDNFDVFISELTISDVPFNAGTQSYVPIPHGEDDPKCMILENFSIMREDNSEVGLQVMSGEIVAGENYNACYELRNTILVNSMFAVEDRVNPITPIINGSNNAATSSQSFGNAPFYPDLIIVDEISSIEPTNYNFLNIKDTSTIRYLGAAPVISINNAGIDGNNRPDVGGYYTIGANQYSPIPTVFNNPIPTIFFKGKY